MSPAEVNEALHPAAAKSALGSPLASRSGTLESVIMDLDPALVDEAAELEGPRPYTEEDRKRDADWYHGDEPPEDDPAKWPPGLGSSAPKLSEHAPIQSVH